MTETDSGQRQERRRKRVRLIKRMIVGTILTAIFVPTVLCIYLFVELNNAQKQLAQLQQTLTTSRSESGEEAAVETSIFVTTPLEESARTVTGKPTEQVKEVAEGRIKVYLTFDDGPSSNTGAILDVLKEYDVKATFFVVGKTDEQSRQLYKRIVEEGHTLGMHSFSHKYQEVYQSVESFCDDLIRLQEYLYEETGVWCRYYRFPGGSSNTVSKVDMQELIGYLNQQDITYFDWNIGSGDAASGRLAPQQIVSNCLTGMNGKNSGMILLHDSAEKKSTVEALPDIITGILAMENTEILPVSDETVLIQHITAKED